MNRFLLHSLLTGTIIAAVAPAFASDIGDNSPVPRLPDARPLEKRIDINPVVGLFIGGSAGVVYDDNINKQKVNKKDDELFFKPVRLEGDAWNVKGISFK
jgi:hypothetical protein